MTAGATTAASAPPAGEVAPPTPYFRLRRPFDAPDEVRASRFYPYGTTADGQYLLHHGLDFGNPMGTPVVAIADGRVVYAGLDDRVAWGPEPDFYGRLVVLEHPNLPGGLLYSLYGHLSAVNVPRGREVRAGDVIGQVGAAGIALGPHLHLEIRTDARDYEATRNAELFLAPLAEHGTIVGTVLDADGQTAPDIPVGLYRLDADGSETWIGQTTTYPADHVNPSAYWAENFLFADTPVGRYTLAADLGGLRASAAVTVTDGGVVRVDLAATP
jgi:murein DD-endopeptidase MepM/ murein hydrolase activator NlpD